MPGADAGEDVHPLDPCFQVLVGHLIQVRPGQHLATWPQEADLLGDGAGGVRVVAGDHNGADPCPSGLLHRRTDLRPGRVDHRHQADERQVLLYLLGVQRLRQVVHQPVRHSQHPQRFPSQIPVDVFDVLAAGRGERDVDAVFQDGVTAREDDVGRALDVDDVPGGVLSVGPCGLLSVQAVDRAHPLAVRVEGDLCHAGHPGLDFLPPEPGLGGGDHQRALRGIAHHPIAVPLPL